jgi:hypothetical protein
MTRSYADSKGPLIRQTVPPSGSSYDRGSALNAARAPHTPRERPGRTASGSPRPRAPRPPRRATGTAAIQGRRERPRTGWGHRHRWRAPSDRAGALTTRRERPSDRAGAPKTDGERRRAGREHRRSITRAPDRAGVSKTYGEHCEQAGIPQRGSEGPGPSGEFSAAGAAAQAAPAPCVTSAPPARCPALAPRVTPQEPRRLAPHPAPSAPVPPSPPRTDASRRTHMSSPASA